MIIQENDIEQIIAKYEDEDTLVADVSALIKDHPMIAGFLMQESNEVLTNAEKDLLWFLVVVILSTYKDKGLSINKISVETLSRAEEKNWQTYDEIKGPYEEKIDAFFEETKEEELLAFVEDMVSIDEDSEVTTVGREVILVVCKSIIDQVRIIKEI